MVGDNRRDVPHDYKRDALGNRYSDGHSVRNWLLYRKIAKAEGKDCDRLALKDELAQVHQEGFKASADSMNSLWLTYRRAIEIWGGPSYSASEEGLSRLLDHYDTGAEPYAEINELFSAFASLTHTLGNFILVPLYNPSDERPRSFRSLNTLRAGKGADLDYWDLTLARIKSGEYSEFFAGNPKVAARFNISAMPGGFSDFVDRNHLEAYLGDDGEVAPLWPGHLDGPERCLPQTKSDVRAFLDNACRAIEVRGAAIKECERCASGGGQSESPIPVEAGR